MQFLTSVQKLKTGIKRKFPSYKTISFFNSMICLILLGCLVALLYRYYDENREVRLADVPESDMYYIKKSPINGVGLFAKRELKRGDVLGLGVENVFKAERGGVRPIIASWARKINHCDHAYNIELKNEGANYYFVVKKAIRKGEEIIMNYWLTPKTIAKPKKNYVKC